MFVLIHFRTGQTLELESALDADAVVLQSQGYQARLKSVKREPGLSETRTPSW